MEDLKLNIFALPNQTTILFGLTVTVLIGGLLVSSIGSSPILIWPLALALLFLPFRAFLAWPEHEITRYHLVMAGNDFAGLQEKIKAIAEKIGLQRTPKLAICSIKTLLYTFGTLKHWYIAIGEQEALRLQKDLIDENNKPAAEVKLIRELSHFKTGDYWKLGYARELLRVIVVVFVPWNIIFFTGLGFFLLVALPDVIQLNFNELISQLNLTPEMRQLVVQMLPSPAMMEQLRQKASEINMFLVLYFVFSSVLPILLAGGLLRWLYLPKLWRTREFYADAEIVHAQGEALPFLAAVTGISLSLLKKYPHILSGTQTAYQQKTAFTELTQNHPPTATRIAHIKKPGDAFANWLETAMLVGSFTLILDILQSSSLTLLYVGKWPMHFSTLIIFVLVSLSFIPALVQGRSVKADLLKITSMVVVIRLAWLLFTIGLLVLLFAFAPETLPQMLDAAIARVAHSTGRSEELAFDSLSAFVTKASAVNLVQLAIVFVFLLAALTGVTFLLRRLLTWYGFPEAKQRLMKVAYGIIGFAALFFAMTVLPLITMALLRPVDLLNPTSFITPVLGLMITATGLVWFFRANQKYAKRCPNCGASVVGSFHLGKRCDACDGALFHPWLIAEYRT